MDRLETLQAEQSNQVEVKLFACDLSDANSRTQLLHAFTEQHLNIDYLVNNAGCGQFGDIADNDWAATDAMLQLNMVALSHMTRSLLPAMNSGKVITIHGLFNRLRIFSLRSAPRAIITAITASILKREQ